MAKITDAQFAEQIKDYSEEQKSMLLNVREQVKGLELAMNAEFKTAEQVEADLTALKSQYATNEAFKELQGQLLETATKVANMKNKNFCDDTIRLFHR
jgi:methionine salvage enolase-phosphatase E1